MGRTYSRQLFYKDTGDSNRVKVYSGLTNVKLQPITSSYPSGAIALSETGVGTGIYKNNDVADGVYILYINDVSKETDYGQFWIGDDDLSPYAKKAGGNTFSGDQTFEDDIQIDGDLNVDLDIIARELFINASGAPYTSNTPSYASSVIWLAYLESRLSALIVTPYQESKNRVRVIVEGTNETGKVYTAIKAASASFASPGANNQCLVDIIGTGSISKYINMDAGSMRDYVHFAGAGKHIFMICRDGVTNSKISNLENMTIIFGANDFTGDRTYANKRIENCDIYLYKNMTWNNTDLFNCRVIHASTYKSTFTGTSKVEKCGFNNEPDYSGISGGYQSNNYGIDVSSLPTDPSTPEGSGIE